MAVVHLSHSELIAMWADAGAVAEPAVPGEPLVLLVDADGLADDEASVPPRWPAVVVAWDPAGSERRPAWADLVVTCQGHLDDVVRQVHDTPIASTALVQLLRGAEGRSSEDGLLLESAVYSTLQAGPEFARWRSAHNPAHSGEITRVGDGAPPVIGVRKGADLVVRLHRPHVHNALDCAMRDALIELLSMARFDESIQSVTLMGDGPSYSAGGDLNEFGTFSDVASAHLVRTTAALGPLLTSLGDRLVVRLHGTCLGSGIEVPAFASRVIALPDVSIGLPELRLGLIPGAGGTWSLPQRIGRHRTAWLALTGRRIDGATAHAWGLVDALV